MRNKFYQVISALSSFTPSLLYKKLTLTAALANIPSDRITSITVTEPVPGLNGTCTSGSEATIVVGRTYYVTVTTNQYNNGQKVVHTYSYEALTTTLGDLTNAFVGLINAKVGTGKGYVASNSSSHLVLTESPLSGQIAGEYQISYTWIDENGTTFATITDSSRTLPKGQGAQLDRLAADPGVQFVGSVTTANTYVTVEITYTTSGGERVVDTLFYDKALTAAEEAYIKTFCQHIAGELGIGAGMAMTITGNATDSVTGTAVIPVGVSQISVADVTNGETFWIGVTSGNVPANWKLFALTGSTSSKWKTTGSETFNGGTGSVLLVPSKLHRITKFSTTAWNDVAMSITTGAISNQATAA